MIMGEGSREIMKGYWRKDRPPMWPIIRKLGATVDYHKK